MKIVTYQGIFFDENSVQKLIESQKENLAKIVSNLHCTFKFKPSKQETEKFFDELGGKDISLKVIGYASDGKNSGFEIELTEELKNVYGNIQKENVNGEIKDKITPPHITVSISEEGKPVDTGRLKFEKLETSFFINGRAGAFVVDRDRRYSNVEFESPYRRIENDAYDEI